MNRYPSEEEILDALRTIKSVCEAHQRACGSDGCYECPFSFEDRCPFIEGDAPKDWKIATLPGVWKAFSDAT